MSAVTKDFISAVGVPPGRHTAESRFSGRRIGAVGDGTSIAGRALFSAGWSSPVARQAHNLKVGRSNRPPASNRAAVICRWNVQNSAGTLGDGRASLCRPFSLPGGPATDGRPPGGRSGSLRRLGNRRAAAFLGFDAIGCPPIALGRFVAGARIPYFRAPINSSADLLAQAPSYFADRYQTVWLLRTHDDHLVRLPNHGDVRWQQTEKGRRAKFSHGPTANVGHPEAE